MKWRVVQRETLLVEMLAADWRAILAAATSWLVVSTMVALLQCPIFPGRQLKKLFPAFTQAQPLQEPVLSPAQSPAPPNDATEATLSAPPDSVSPPVSDNSLPTSAQVASSSPPLPILQPLNFPANEY